MKKIKGFLGLGAAATLCLSLNAIAQSTTQGAISGTVFDTTEAVVSGAKVLIHNDGTNQDVTLTSSGSGEYTAPLLPPGTYTVTVDAPGFASSKTTQVVVSVSSVTTLNPHLKTGNTEQVVEVVADIPAIDFASGTYGGHLDNTEIENIPINNRRWSSLALVTPGVTNDTSGFGLLSFRAIASTLNNVQIDGTDDNQAFFGEERGRTRAGYSTSQVAVREFQVNTGVYSAEYGRAVGGVVNSVTKSGSNALHGEVYFYHRNDKLSSINPKVTFPVFNSATGVTTPVPYKPKDKRNQYGFGAGGALIKDKLFWFYAFDAFKRNFPGVAVPANPSNFYTQAVTTANGGTAAQNTLAGQVIAAGFTPAQYNATMAELGTNLGPVPRYGNQIINTPKLDWQINSKHHVSFLYHRLRWDSPGGVQTQAALNYARDSFGTDFVKLDYGVAKLDSLITSHFTNEVRYQYARELNNQGQQPYTDYTKNRLTQANGRVAQFYINTSAGFQMGSPYYSYRTAYPDERKWQVGDTASYLFGKHNLRFGTDIVHNFDVQNTLGNSTFTPTGGVTYGSFLNYVADVLKPSGACASSTGALPAINANNPANNFACYSNIQQMYGNPSFALSTTDYAFFVQDDYKMRPNLTLNLGVRYDYEKIPNQYANLITLPQTGNTPNDKNNFAPRIGFAWDPYNSGKTVLRGGYGMYYGRVPNGLLLATYLSSGSANGQSGYQYFNSTVINGSTIKFPNTSSVAPPPSSAPANITYFDKNFQNPYTQQFDLAVQQNVGMNNVLSIAYIGSLGRQLPNYLNVNLNPANTYNATFTVAGTGNCGPVACGTTFTNKVYANRFCTAASATACTSSNFSALLNPSYNSITSVVSNINSSYHALTVDLTKRAGKLVSYDVNYTWAKALDFNQQSITQAGTNNWLDPYANARSNYGNSSLMVKHRVVGWMILNIPGVKGNGAVSYVTNGWSIKPLIQMQSGLPYSINVSGTALQSGFGTSCSASTPCLIPFSTGFGGTSVTYIPQLGRNSQFAPRTIVVDARLQKDFKLHEKYTFQLMAEGFNLANHQNITSLNTTAYNLTTANTNNLTYQTNFGTASSSGVNGNYAYQVRQFQFSGRIVF